MRIFVAEGIQKNTVCRVFFASLNRNQRNCDRVKHSIIGTADKICAIVGFAVVPCFFQRQAAFLVIFVHIIYNLVCLHTGGTRGRRSRRQRFIRCLCRVRLTAGRQSDYRKGSKLKKCSSFHDFCTSPIKLLRSAQLYRGGVGCQCIQSNLFCGAQLLSGDTSYKRLFPCPTRLHSAREATKKHPPSTGASCPEKKQVLRLFYVLTCPVCRLLCCGAGGCGFAGSSLGRSGLAGCVSGGVCGGAARNSSRRPCRTARPRCA